MVSYNLHGLQDCGGGSWVGEGRPHPHIPEPEVPQCSPSQQKPQGSQRWGIQCRCWEAVRRTVCSVAGRIDRKCCAVVIFDTWITVKVMNRAEVSEGRVHTWVRLSTYMDEVVSILRGGTSSVWLVKKLSGTFLIFHPTSNPVLYHLDTHTHTHTLKEK